MMNLSVHTPVADRLISLFLARGHVLTRNTLRMLLITHLLLRRELESHQQRLDFAISEFNTLLVIRVLRLLCSYRLEYSEQPRPLTSFSTLLGQRTILYIAMFLLFCGLASGFRQPSALGFSERACYSGSDMNETSRKDHEKRFGVES